MVMPPDPYMLKLVETATKATIEIIHQEVKSGLAYLTNLIDSKAKDRAIKNANVFGEKFESVITHRISVGVSPDGRQRIEGNLSDPDFAYVVQQATIAAARTYDESKHKILAEIVAARLLAKPDSLVALASNKACEIIPNLSPMQLNYLGLLAVVLSIRPTFDAAFYSLPEQLRIAAYTLWLEKSISLFAPFPKPTHIDVLHLTGLGCVYIIPPHFTSLESTLGPNRDYGFSLPKDHFVGNKLIDELATIDVIRLNGLTSMGQIIGSSVYDARSGDLPTNFQWDPTE